MRTNGIMDEKLELMLEHATVKTSEKEDNSKAIQITTISTTNLATDPTTDSTTDPTADPTIATNSIVEGTAVEKVARE